MGEGEEKGEGERKEIEEKEKKGEGAKEQELEEEQSTYANSLEKKSPEELKKIRYRWGTKYNRTSVLERNLF